MKNHKLKFILLFICHLFDNNVFCTDADLEIKLFDIGIRFFKHCYNDAKNIRKYLQPFDEAELHVFWTSGRDPKILQKKGIKSQI